MLNDRIEGKWMGWLDYDDSYPPAFRNKKLAFRISLWMEDGMLKGICEDDITIELSLAPATLEGGYHNDELQFIKRYSCEVIINERNELQANSFNPPANIYYTGRLKKKFLTGKYYVQGTWQITNSYVDGPVIKHYTVGGSWMMEKV
ncbi:hypothetical protein [Foetidibacter luteolus]|uniref:hypothetical protein n=1 Tax=Foetidibacter luteolus TaxID=2608880 RepID=UPI00129A91AD|nr:hypothetical protein [Foetidibacter luteolus]